ncbi:MAG: alpha-L-fucosidase [Bernardetiaceae bacterium]|jgi:alpha-L-fucosidase|nr:alpha-L-fucosidase [Bernardetiaceae bacterium]
MNRRQFLAALPATSLLTSQVPAGPGLFSPALANPEPDAAQKAWMALKFGLFIHFGINTFYNLEWSDGTLDPKGFNPPQVDTDQWCAAAQRAGMKYVVLVTKHHDGFCNWPTAHTAYSVKSSPFRGDVVGQLVHSARQYGLAVGLYYSLWDRHEPTHQHDEPAYVDFMLAQLDELLGNYGPVVELWLDGMWKKQASGWKTPDGKFAPAEQFIQAWRNEGAYRWQIDRVYQHIKRKQPNCLVMNNATSEFPGVPLHPVDARCGEKVGQVLPDQKIWRFANRERYLPLQIETTLSRQGHQGQFASGSWFWHPGDVSVANPAQVRQWQQIAAQMEANLLLNAGPMTNGQLRPQDWEVLTKLNP